LDLVGGLEQFLKSIEGFPYLRLEKILDYLKKFNEKSLYQKTGFVLDYFKEQWSLPSDSLDKLASLVSSNIYYLVPSAKGSSKFVKRWNLMVPTKLISEGNRHAISG
jgi:predicted transcriptional regulator of viral defense system